MSAPAAVLQLVERFHRNEAAYRSGRYNETQARRELIDPLFKALGWDVDNEAGYAEAYKDVVHEDAIKVGGETKAPDYCFRVGGTRKFFVEAKKPSVNLRDDTAPAYQLRRYAWSAKLPLSIVTDFEELAVYDCRSKPSPTDSAAVARTLYLTYDQYADRWEEIASIFSKKAVLHGSFDRYAEDNKAKRGTAEVDKAFLAEIERWRELLARNFALRNPSLTVRELNYAVQVTIDRIVFLRICEDRGIEEYGLLQTLLNGGSTYGRLLELFHAADHRYNSGLFHFDEERGRPGYPDTLTPGLILDDKSLKDIVRNLYYPDSPYEFSVLPADILGQVYEQFLGKVIRLTAGHQAKVEDKPEVKKAGGVYYTPTYIVDYIVEHTVGELLKGSTPKRAAELRILDPACGSGSFLIGAYQHLLDWHRDWYVEHGPEKHRKELYQGTGGEWRLTTAEKRRILLNNLYGVDIDPQAVEVTKLSLCLKLLEGENAETINSQLSLVRERALPDLRGNIKCGNSLIGTDFYAGEQLALLDEETRYRINAFDWDGPDGFQEIMARGGFDAVIGNPPYLNIEHLPPPEREYFVRAFSTVCRRFDAYGLFVELGMKLLATGGRFGMIVPSTLLNNLSFAPLRKALLERTRVRAIVNLGGRVFAGVNNDTVILVFELGTESSPMTEIADVQDYGASLAGAVGLGQMNLVERALPPGYEFELRVTEEALDVLRHMTSERLVVGDFCNCFQGFVTGGNAAFIVNEGTIDEEGLEGEVCRPAVFGGEVSRYERPKSGSCVLYLTRDSAIEDYPNVKRHLAPFEALLAKKREVRLGRQPWYSLHWPRVEVNFERPEKILVQAIRNLALKRRVVATMDRDGLYADHTLNVLYAKSDGVDLRMILGVLNSSLVNWYFRKKHIDINVKGVYLTAVPLPGSLFGQMVHGEESARFVQAVDRMLALRERLSLCTVPSESTRLARQVDALDSELDHFVYRFFGLSEREIAIVESGTDG